MAQDQPEAGDPERTRSLEVDGPTVSLSSDTPTTTGPTIATWSLDDLMQDVPSGPLVWQAEPRPAYARPRQGRGAVYYASLTVAVMLVLGMIGGLVVLSLNRPVTTVAGEATGLPIPELPAPTHSTPPGASTPGSADPQPADPMAALAEHPLSTSNAAMSPLTCALPRFDPADAAQARFYAAAKVCADGGFGALLPAAGLPAVAVRVVTVQGGPADTPCGPVEQTAPATQCEGTVYMTPARLRDGEGLDRYPGKYFGVFLREYASAVQFGAGLTELYEGAKASPDAPGDLADRLAEQATCLAGIVSGAMAGRGAVDANITNEIRERLTSTDAPPDADTWLDKGFQTRQPASCNTWS
jgi:hypothetical protein